MGKQMRKSESADKASDTKQVRPAKPNKEGNNVTQSKKPGRSGKESIQQGRSSGKLQNQGKKGNEPNSAAATGTKPRSSRSHRPGGSVNGQVPTNGHGPRSKEHDTRPECVLSSSHKRSGSSPRISERGVSDVGSRADSVVDRVWKATDVRRANHSGGTTQVTNQASFLHDVWRNLIKDVYADFLPFFDDSIEDRGLVGTIVYFQGLAMVLINDQLPTVLDAEIVRVLRMTSKRDALQILRFGKRYTPSEWTVAEQDAILKQFKLRNRRAKLIDRNGLPRWFVRLVKPIGKSIFRSFLKGRSFDEVCESRSFTSDWHHLPSGTTAEGWRNPFEKWAHLSASWGYIDPLVAQGIPHNDIGEDVQDVPSKLVMVPKDYRGPRIIMEECMERTLQQSYTADALFKLIETPTFSPYCPYGKVILLDQERNQHMARLGAEFGYFATIDLKDASDSITYALVHACFPADVAKRITCGASKAVRLPSNEVIPLYMPCTMGSRCTVPVQSLIYWIIICAAVHLAISFGIIPDDLSILLDCSAYNDDIVVPSVLYDIVCALLEAAKLIVNHDKSYTDGHAFRESCGVDYYIDQDVTSIYWPRRSLSLVNEDVPSLCALHNRLYERGAMRAANVVRKAVLSILPTVPLVLPGDETIGLYSEKTNRTVTPYVCYNSGNEHLVHLYDVGYDLKYGRTLVVSDAPLNQTEPNYDWYNSLATVFGCYSPRYITSANVTTLGDVGKLVHSCIYETVAIVCRFSDGIRCYARTVDELLNKGAKFSSLDCDGPIEVPHFYNVACTELVQTYDNRLTPANDIDYDIISKKIIDDLVERFEYERWLLDGSRYYDPVCELVGVTQPSRIRKRLYPKGYKTRKYSCVTCDSVIVASHFHPNLYDLVHEY